MLILLCHRRQPRRRPLLSHRDACVRSHGQWLVRSHVRQWLVRRHHRHRLRHLAMISTTTMMLRQLQQLRHHHLRRRQQLLRVRDQDHVRSSHSSSRSSSSQSLGSAALRSWEIASSISTHNLLVKYENF